MNRRRFLLISLASALAAPIAPEAQQAGTVSRTGFISVSYAPIEDILFQQFGKLGYVEGENLLVEGRYSEGRGERLGPPVRRASDNKE